MAGSAICQACGNVTSFAKEEVAVNKKTGIGYAIVGWVFFVLSLILIPFLTGAISLFMGYMTYNERNKTHGAILMVFATMGIVLGSLLSIMVAGTMFF